MAASKKFLRQLTNQFDRKAAVPVRQVATMGRSTDSALYANAARTFVYVEFGNGIAVPIFNNRVDAQLGRKVVVGIEPPQPFYQVLSTYSETPNGDSFSSEGNLSHHGWRHAFMGPDFVPVHLRGITELRISTTYPASLSVKLERGIIRNAAGEPIEVASETVNLTAHIPSTSGKAALVLITINNSGANVQTKGAEVNLADLCPEGNRFANLPARPAGTRRIRGAVRVYNGQTAVREGLTNTDIIDLRFSELNADLFSDGEGNPADVITGAASDGISAFAARRDHVHHYDPVAVGKYRQFVYSVDAGVMGFVVDEDGYPVMSLEDLE